MWFSLFGLVLILCIAFFQGLQGLFSALIMCVLTILCAALALGTFEDLYYAFLIDHIPNYGLAVAICAVFILSLLILRTLADNVIKGSMVFPVLLDRAGGGIFGLMSGMVIVGVLQISFQLLPFSESFLGYDRFVSVDRQSREVISPDNEDSDFDRLPPEQIVWERKELLLKPDAFTAGLVTALSKGTLSARQSFADTYPDFTAWLQNGRTGVQRESLQSLDSENAIDVPGQNPGYWTLGEGEMVHPSRTERDAQGRTEKTEIESVPEPGNHFRVYRVLLGKSAVEQAFFRFRAPQVRIVGRDRPNGPVTEHLLKGIQSAEDTRQYLQLYRCPILGERKWADVVRKQHSTPEPFDFVFEVPDSFQAHFIEFKRTARVDVSKLKALPEESIPGYLPAEGQEQPSARESRARRTREAREQAKDRVSGVALFEKPAYEEKLPIRLTQYSGNAEVARGRWVSGHITAPLHDQPTTGGRSSIETFDIPDGQHLLFVPVVKLDPRSFLGNALDAARRVVGQVRLQLDNGTEIEPTGMYAIADVNGHWWFEGFYLDETARTAGEGGKLTLTRFQKIRNTQLRQDDTELVYLFLVPDGRTAKGLALPRREPLDLSQYHLKAGG
jgi:hypothetical protein